MHMTISLLHANQRRLALLVGGGVLAAVVVLLGLGDEAPSPSEEASVHPWAGSPDPAPPDPRWQADIVYRNVRPTVRYVGDAACRDCHADIAAAYQQHSMGRSATTALRESTVERWQPLCEVHGPYRLAVSEQRQHRLQAAADGPEGPAYQLTLDVAIGSGTRGRSYLSLDQGALWQSPLSWYSEAQRWDVSPGFDLGQGGRRPIAAECLFCHTHLVEPLPGALNRYHTPLFPLQQAAIGCERCHGPGAVHVEERRAALPIQGSIDTSIVNPRHLDGERQQDICRQCHLQGQVRVARRGRQMWEYRPGLEWDAFVRVAVRHPDWSNQLRSVGQFEQMEQSRCYVASKGQLRCVSCHDPHALPPPQTRVDYYRQRCLQCHPSHGCTCPQPSRDAQQNNCIACHMPRAPSSNIAHTSVTDHRIVRRATPPPLAQPPSPDTFPLLLYRHTQVPVDALDCRDLAIALAHLSRQWPASAAMRRYLEWAAAQLENALSLHCGDVDAWVALGQLRLQLGQWSHAWQAMEYAVQLQPEHELAWRHLAELAVMLRRWDRAEMALEQLYRCNPRQVDYLLLYAALRIAQKQWELAAVHCQRALAIHPLHPQALLYEAVCQCHQGEPARAQATLSRALSLCTTPDQRQHYRHWFRQHTQQPK
jgi:cytochrome c-type biogenesis protein CcmH/NrfG